MASSAAHHLVTAWIDDAMELVSGMHYTCSLDVARDYPAEDGGLPEVSVAQLLGVSPQAISAELKTALGKLRVALPCDECGAAGGKPCTTLRGQVLDEPHRGRGRDEIGELLGAVR